MPGLSSFFVRITGSYPSREAARRIIFWMSIVLVLCATGCAEETPEQKLEKVRQDVRNQYADVQQISTADLADWLADATRTPPLLLDVRKKAEYAVSHLKGARRIEPGKPSAGVLQSLDPNREIVVYCSVGVRSSKLARELQKRGFRNVFNLDGSIFQWANEGRPLFNGDLPVTNVHPYNHRWGRLLNRDPRPRR